MGAGIPPSLELFYDFNGEEIPAMGDGSGLAGAMLGIHGVRVTNVCEAYGEVTIEVETTEPRSWYERRWCCAESRDRMWVDLRSGVLRPANPTQNLEAPVAIPRGALCSPDVDRTARVLGRSGPC